MSDTPNFDPGALGLSVDEPAAAPRVPAAKRKASRRSSDQLGIVWVHGSLNFGVLRQRKMLAHWSPPGPVRTLEEFSAALDEALTQLTFGGTETFLVLAGEPFVHQTESAPGFSAGAARHFLQGRVARHAQEHEPVLWVAQPTVSAKPDDKAFLLHLLPQSFYSQLNRLLLAHRLDLTRILPMTVPVQREMNGFPVTKGQAALAAVEVADATIVVIARVGGPILFARTILASLVTEPVRVAIEINRSLLYAKQQFSESVDRIWILSRSGRALEEVKAKCGAGKTVMVLPTQPEEWLQTVTRVAPHQPVNLVASYLKRKQRQQFLRRALLAGAWLGLALLGLDGWTRAQDWRDEHARLSALRAHESVLVAERDRLAARNRKVEHEQEFVRQVTGGDLAPVPGKFLAYLASILPAEIRLTDFSVKAAEGGGGWTFQLDGTVAADEDSARELLGSLKKHLARSPLRARFNDASRAFGTTTTGGGATGGELQRFNLEGAILEN